MSCRSELTRTSGMTRDDLGAVLAGAWDPSWKHNGENEIQSTFNVSEDVYHECVGVRERHFYTRDY